MSDSSTRQTGWPDCVPTLTDGVVVLRAHADEDRPRIVEASVDPLTSHNVVTIPQPYGLEQAREFVEHVATEWERPDGAHEWAVSDAHGSYLGSVNLHARSAARAEIGFALHPDARGRGVAARAVRLLLTRAFDAGVEVVRWRARAGNWGSRRVAWACGFTDPVTVTAAELDRDGRPIDVWHSVIRRGEPFAPRHWWPAVPVLDGQRVRLRPMREQDADGFPVEPVADLWRYLRASFPHRASYAAWLALRRERQARGESLQWCVADPATDRPMGTVQLFDLGHPGTEGTALIGYGQLPEHRGRGLGGEAVDLVVRHALAPVPAGGLGLESVKAYCDITNLASARLLRAAGFRQVGQEPAAYPQADEPPTDALVFVLTRTDDRTVTRIRPLAIPVVETARFRLRPFRESDAPDQDPDEVARRFVPARGLPTTADWPQWFARRQRFADEGVAVNWCIADRATDRCLGNVLLFHLDPADRFQAELGYWLHPSARGRATMTEVLPPVLDHAFDPVAAGGLGLTRVHAGTDSDNTASQRVLLRAGLREWGRDRQAFRRQDGSLSDGTYFEILATDPRPPAGEPVTPG